MPFRKILTTTTLGRSGVEAIKQSLLDEVDKAAIVIGQLDDLTYIRHSDRAASIGAQFRHCLDFLNTFLTGVKVGRIDYTRRERDLRVECSREYTLERFEAASRRISELRSSGTVSVRSEIDGSTWLQSSVAREMEFVLSHTIHHHALIVEKLLRQGVTLDSVIGVAPSTKQYRERLAA